jgi:hypothetical protein
VVNQRLTRGQHRRDQQKSLQTPKREDLIAIRICLQARTFIRLAPGPCPSLVSLNAPRGRPQTPLGGFPSSSPACGKADDPQRTSPWPRSLIEGRIPGGGRARPGARVDERGSRGTLIAAAAAGWRWRSSRRRRSPRRTRAPRADAMISGASFRPPGAGRSRVHRRAKRPRAGQPRGAHKLNDQSQSHAVDSCRVASAPDGTARGAPQTTREPAGEATKGVESGDGRAREDVLGPRLVVRPRREEPHQVLPAKRR